MPRTSSNLPVELLFSIFELLRPDDLDRSLLQDLAARALVSRTFNAVVFPILYRTVVFPRGTDADVQYDAFHRSLQRSPRLGAAVRNLIMPFPAFGVDAAFGGYQKLLPASIVHLCPHLRSLEVSAAHTTALFAAISISSMERLSQRKLDHLAAREMMQHTYPRLSYLHLDLRGTADPTPSFDSVDWSRAAFPSLASVAVSTHGYEESGFSGLSEILRSVLSQGMIERVLVIVSGILRAGHQDPSVHLRQSPVYPILMAIRDRRLFVDRTYLSPETLAVSRAALLDESRLKETGEAVCPEAQRE
ncbi:hypothetical protein AURDEDRAFT_166668 [Auricularia subglabra TFB-10046 SS5]|nr:hypothetical protein AURDEDRAFT_166668 [Auricularia subglabra TFB-10046 SS5]